MFTVPPRMEWGVTRPPPHPPSPKPPASPTTSTGGGIHRHMHKHIHIHTVYISSSTFTHTTYVYTHVYIYIYIRICIISLHTHIGTIIISGGRGGPPDTGPYIFTYTEWIMMHHIIYVIYIYIYIRRYHVLQQKQQCSTISQVIFKLPLTPCHQCWSCLNWNC